MHIVFVTVDFVENNGPTTGLPKYLLRVSKALIKKGHKVSIITYSNRNITYDYYGIRVYRVAVKCNRIRNPKYRDFINHLEIGFGLQKKLRELVKRNIQIDVVQYTSLRGIALWHSVRVPAVLRLSSYARIAFSPISKEEKLKVRLNARLERWSAISMQKVFAPAYVTANAYSKDIKRSVDVIETPFVMEEEQEDNSIYKEYFYGKKYFLFYGSLVDYKGIYVIRDMLFDFFYRHKEYYFAVIGKGNRSIVSEMKKYSGEFQDRLIYLDGLGFSSLKPIIKGAEAIVLPSIMENFSNACVESMALGKIVIGTDGASFEQLITDNENGFLVQIGNSDSLLEAVNKVIALDDNKKRAMSKKAKERADKLHPDYVVDELIKYYEKVIEHSSHNYKKS